MYSGCLGPLLKYLFVSAGIMLASLLEVRSVVSV